MTINTLLAYSLFTEE